MNTLGDTYKKEIRPKLSADLGNRNPMATPHLVKIVVNVSMGEALKDKKTMESMVAQIAVITGQKPLITKAKKAISTFKLREGDAIGIKVTMRGTRMYDFLTRLISVALPRVRDFRGIPLSGFDGNGNYTMGIREQTIFPDLDYKLVDRIRGFEVTFVTSARDNKDAQMLLTALGLPFEKKES